MSDGKRIVQCSDAPAAVGPYSQAVAAGGFIFCSGMIPLDPATAKLVEGEIEQQTRRALDNLKAVLGAAGSSMGNVVKTTVFLIDMEQFKRFNAVYAEYFPEAPPARSTVQVAKLPLGASVEVEAIALADDPQ